MKKIILILILLFTGVAQSQLIIDNTLKTPAQLVQDVLVGNGVVPTNIQFNRSAAAANAIRDQAAEFSTNFNPTNLGLNAGILLTTGKATVAYGPNNTGSRSVQTATATTGDADLALLSGQAINNVAILEFDFVATGLILNFDYVFASEEYPEFTASAFNDTFGFFLSGMGLSGPYTGGAINIALTPTTNTGSSVVSIGNVNNGIANAGPVCRNCAYYVNNGTGTTPAVNVDIQYDGFTVPLRATAPLVCGETYHIKLAIANAGPGNDNLYDSGVFIKNFRIQPLELLDNLGLNNNPGVCYGEIVTIYSGITPSANILKWYKDGVLLPGETSPNLTVTQSGIYTLEEYTPSGCRLAVDDITITYKPEIPSTPPLDLTLCTSLPGPYEFNIDQTTRIASTINTTDYIFTYYDTNANLEAYYGLSAGVIQDSDLASYFISTTTATIYVRIEEIATGCISVKSFNLNVIPSPSGSISYVVSPYCNNLLASQPITNTGLTSGGTYSALPAGLIINTTTGAITPFGSTVDNYIVTYEIPATADCPLFSVTTLVSIEDCTCTVTASPSLPQTICIGTPITTIDYTSSTVATTGSVPVADLPPGVTGSFSGSTFTISGTPTAVGLYTFTVTLQTGITDTCTATTTIDIKNQPNAGTGGSIIVCDSSTTPISLFGLVAGGQSGGVWSQLTGSGGVFDAVNGTFTPALGATTSTFRYTITGVAPCLNDTSDVTITINPQPNAGTLTGPVTICDSSTTMIDLFGLLTGEQTGGVWTRLTGTGGSFNAVAGTFTPASGATNSTFEYTLTGTLPCVNVSNVVTININAEPNAGVSGAPLVICDSSNSLIDLYLLINGEQSGGIWTHLTGTGGLFDAVNGTYTPASGATDSTFKYEITGTSPCVTSNSIASITINDVPDAGIANPTIDICDSSTVAIDLFGLISGEQTGGVWTQLTGSGGIFNAVAATFTPTPGALTSTFRYTIAGVLPCIDDTVDAAITIHAQPNAGTDGTVTICESNTALIDLYGLINGEQAGGIWTRLTGNGGLFDAVNGTFTPITGATDSTFQYELTATFPCVNSTSIATVNINPQPDAGIANAPLLVCENSNTAIDLFSLITGEQSGGVWMRVIGSGGIFDPVLGTFTPTPGAISSIFDYNIAGILPCIDDNAQVSIAVIAAPNAGTDGVTTVCDNDGAINLYALITGEQTGGTWTQLTGSGGTFNAATGTFTPAPGALTSTFRYTVLGVSPCPNDTSDVIVNINAQPNAGINGTPLDVCENSSAPIDLYSLITGEQSGGIWSRLTGLGGTFDAINGTFTPAVGATNSTFMYEIAGTLPCVNSSSIAAININAQPNAGVDGIMSICDSSTTAIDLYSLITNEQSGGTWTRTLGSGGLFDPGLGTFTPLPGSTSSVFTYSLIGTAPCSNDASTASVNINVQPNAGLDGATAICDSSSIPIDLYTLITGEQLGGTWNRISGSGGTFNALNGTFIPGVGATTSVFQYTLIGISPCLDDTSLATVDIHTQPNAGIGIAPQIVCESATTTIDLFSLISGEQSGGTWSRTSGTGGSFNASAGTFIPTIGTTSSTFTYTIIGSLPCTNASSLASLTILPNATISLTSGVGSNLQNICINNNVGQIQYSISNGAITASITSGGLPLGVNAIFSSGVLTISGTALEAGTFNYVVSTVGGCGVASLSGMIIVKPEVTLTLTSSPMTTIQTACMNVLITPIKYSVTNGATGASVSGLPTGITGVYSGGVFTISGSTSQVGTYSYVVTTVGGCGLVTQNGTITITQNPTIVLTSAPSTTLQTLCIDNPITPITYEVNNGATGASLISGTVPDGIQGSFNQITKVFTISGIAIESGNFTYTISTTGGCGVATLTGTIRVNPIPMVSLPQDGFICVDVAGVPTTQYLLNTNLSSSVYGFEWSDINGVFIGEIGNNYTASAPGYYSVKVTNLATQCVNSAGATIVPSLPPSQVFTSVTSFFEDNQMVTISVTPPGNYLYQLDTGLFQSDAFFTNLFSGHHTITVKDRFSCGTANTSFRIVNYPKFFTPNGDGYNDTWNIFELADDQPEAYIYIFDRYGKLMKEISVQGLGWDGSFNGLSMPSTDYWFKVFYKENGEFKEFRSHFSLKR